MKHLFNTKFLLAGLLFSGIFVACSDDDDAIPPVVNESELITTVIIEFEAQNANDPNSDVTITFTDLDGDGPNPPVVDQQGSFLASTTYAGFITLLDESQNPVEDISLEIEDEADEHEFFYLLNNLPNSLITKTDTDLNGNPLGLEFTFNAGSAANGTLTVILLHELTKPNNGDPATAGGDVDLEITLPMVIN
ncbi:MAG: type 1 periplasmic binding fold superfamily protein [Flavobacteriaceae bacterium]|nr:type 1 periplasmic binding fold superfamily protein [Flavobacteriaceae bacterium]